MSKERIVVQQNTQERPKTSESVKEVISVPVISEENIQAEIELKKLKEEENNKKIEEIRNDLLNNTEDGSINNEESFLNHEKKEELIVVFKKLKQILEKKEISQEVKDLLQSGDVLGAIAGIKPASYIQPQMEKRIFGIIKQRNGLSSEYLKKFQEILKNFNIDYKIMDGGDDSIKRKEIEKYKSETGVELIHVYNKEKVIDIIESSNLFSEKEVELAKKDVGYFINNYLHTQGYPSVLRVGALYGYALEDVRDAIETFILENKYEQKGLSKIMIKNALEKEDPIILSKIEPTDLKMLKKRYNTKTIHIKGIKNDIQWASYNQDLPEVNDKIKKMQEVFDIAKKILM